MGWLYEYFKKHIFFIPKFAPYNLMRGNLTKFMRKSKIGTLRLFQGLVCLSLLLCCNIAIATVLESHDIRASFIDDYNRYYHHFKDSQQLHPEAITVKDDVDQVAYAITLAQFYVDKFDGENEKSEQLYVEALKKARSLGDQDLLAFVLTQRGYYYYRIRRISLAMPSMLEAVFLVDRNRTIAPPFSAEVYKQIGYFLGTIGDYEQADIFLCRSLSAIDSGSRSERAALLDNRGLYALRVKDTTRAEKYFVEAMQLAQAENDIIRQAKIYGNMALMEWGRNNRQLAIAHFERDLQLSKGKGNELNRLYAVNLLARLLLDEGRLHDAKNYIAQVRAFAETHDNLIVHRNTMHQLLLDIAVMEKDEEAEVLQRRRLYAMQDSLNLFDGENVTKQTRWLAEQKRITERLLDTDKKYVLEKQKLNYLLTVGGLLLLSVAFVGLILYRNRKRERLQQQALLLHFEKEAKVLDDKLSNAEEAIAVYHRSAEQKDHLIKELKDAAIKTISTSVAPNDVPLSKLLTSHLLTEENWMQFKRSFAQAYPIFYCELKDNFPELSDSNLRIVLLWKLDLSTAEISNVLGITNDAIKKAKQRLRKKIGEERYEIFRALLAQPLS